MRKKFIEKRQKKHIMEKYKNVISENNKKN